MPLCQPHTAQLVVWTKKFAPPFRRLLNTHLQKISATAKGELILNVYKSQDDKSLVVLSMKKGESGIYLTQERPVTLKQPNSFVQLAKKYLKSRRVKFSYATISPICIVLEFSNYYSPDGETEELNEGPNCLILDLDTKPPRLILAKKTQAVPSRYEEECGSNFHPNQDFFESWCEWSEDKTKTKKRAAFLLPLISYCPFEMYGPEISNIVSPVKPGNDNGKPSNQDEINDINIALNLLPTHIRRAARTKLQFLERRLHRQKLDLPTQKQINRLKTQSENLKNVLYLWPKESSVWYVPPQFIDEYGLNPIYTLKKGDKPSTILINLYREIEILEKRKSFLSKRLEESTQALFNFQQLVFDSIQQLESLKKLCKILEVSLEENEHQSQLKAKKTERHVYKSYKASTGQFIRVARSASDGDLMLKQMPAHHYWLHVLSGEGSHVWVEKKRGEKKCSPQVLKEAGIIAVHHSKQSRAQVAEVQVATRADIEKKKNLPPGKVLVRRCETFVVRYSQEDLKKIQEG